MFKRLRNALLALAALLGFSTLIANTVQAAYDTPYLKGQVVLKLNWNSYVYDRYGNRMPWFNGLYGPLGYLKKGSYVYTTRKKVERTNKDVRYYFFHGTKIHTYEIDKKYWLPYRKINGHYFYYIGHGAYIKARNVSEINNHSQYSNGEKAMIDETAYTFKFNSKTKKITNLKKKYKYGDYVMVDGLRQFSADDGSPWRDADQPYYARLKGTGHGYTGTYILLGDLRDKDSDMFFGDIEEDNHPNYRINILDINWQESNKTAEKAKAQKSKQDN